MNDLTSSANDRVSFWAIDALVVTEGNAVSICVCTKNWSRND